MAWLYILFAGLLEIAWVIGMKKSQGFTRPLITTLTIVAMIASFLLLAKAMKTLPMGTAYAVWTGIGAAGASVLGMMFFGEPKDIARVLCLTMIVAGVAGLKFFSPQS